MLSCKSLLPAGFVWYWVDGGLRVARTQTGHVCYGLRVSGHRGLALALLPWACFWPQSVPS